LHRRQISVDIRGGTTDGQKSQEESEEDVIRLRREAEQHASLRRRAVERQARGAGDAGPFFLERAIWSATDSRKLMMIRALDYTNRETVLSTQIDHAAALSERRFILS
jgi:hypothetical protein